MRWFALKGGVVLCVLYCGGGGKNILYWTVVFVDLKQFVATEEGTNFSFFIS